MARLLQFPRARPALSIALAALFIAVSFLGLFISPGCHPPPPSRSLEPSLDLDWFEDVTDRVGVQFTHDPGPTGTYLLPQTVGSGCVADDLDGDGRPDLLFLTNAGPGSKSTNKLYRQREDKTFEDVSAGSGLDFAGFNMGVAIGDINNDGKPDVLITQYTGARLFLNLGGMKFQDITESAGLKDPLWGASACFFDYDRDGRLDLVIANYIEYDPSFSCTSPGGEKDFCSPKMFAGTCSKLFRNLGPAPGVPVRFEDVSFSAGLGRASGPGLGVVCADFDGDGWPDIFIANDGKPNRLWINQKDGTFHEEAVSRGVAYTMGGQAYAGMGVAIGDTDNDGLLDLFVTHLGAETNTFWKQGPRGLFRDETTAWRASATVWRGTGFGSLMADFDLDGFLDIAVVNGRVSKGEPQPGPGLTPFWERFAERNQLLANEGGRQFRDVSARNPSFCGQPNVGRGLAAADLDGDGAPDLVVSSIGGRARVYRNICPNRGHWLKVRCLDPKLGRDAYGAEITVHAGAQHWFRVLSPAGSYLSSNSSVALFGVGAAETVDRIEVAWPDGTREVFPGGRTNQDVRLQRGDGQKR